jgi:hypothetical protein
MRLALQYRHPIFWGSLYIYIRNFSGVALKTLCALKNFSGAASDMSFKINPALLTFVIKKMRQPCRICASKSSCASKSGAANRRRLDSVVTTTARARWRRDHPAHSWLAAGQAGELWRQRWRRHGWRRRLQSLRGPNRLPLGEQAGEVAGAGIACCLFTCHSLASKHKLTNFVLFSWKRFF